MKGTFFCELKPTLTAQQYTVKAPCSFYVREDYSGYFDIYGISSSGKQKIGGLDKVIDEDNIEEIGQGVLEGKFTEDGKDVDVVFSYSIFDLDVVLGSGEWVEKVEGKIRQKYNVQIRGAELYHDGAGFVDRLLSRYAELDSSRSKILSDLKELEDRVLQVEKKEKAVSEVVDNFLSKDDELSKALSSSEQLESNLSKLLGEAKNASAELASLEKENHGLMISLSKTSAEAENVVLEAKESKEKANDALSSAITVSIARSFKERKKEAIRQRWTYDILFVVSLCFGIITTYSVFNYILPGGEGLVANIESLIGKLPFLIFFVWLGLFASKKSSSASRIEEFYAQKQALAESYEGYKNEIVNHGEPSQELAQLMAINLLSINKDSSQIFDGVDKEKHSPMHEMLGGVVDRMFFKGKGGVGSKDSDVSGGKSD